MGGGASVGVSAGLEIGNAAGGVINAFGQSKAIKFQSEYEAKQLEFNQQLAELGVKETEREARKAGFEVGKYAKQVKGAQRAAFAGQNVEVDSGSAALVQEDTVRESTLDILKIKNNAWRQAFGFKLDAVGLKYQSMFSRISGAARAKDTLITGGLQAGQSLLKAASSIYGGGK